MGLQCHEPFFQTGGAPFVKAGHSHRFSRRLDSTRSLTPGLRAPLACVRLLIVVEGLLPARSARYSSFLRTRSNVLSSTHQRSFHNTEQLQCAFSWRYSSGEGFVLNPATEAILFSPSCPRKMRRREQVLTEAGAPTSVRDKKRRNDLVPLSYLGGVTFDVLRRRLQTRPVGRKCENKDNSSEP